MGRALTFLGEDRGHTKQEALLTVTGRQVLPLLLLCWSSPPSLPSMINLECHNQRGPYSNQGTVHRVAVETTVSWGYLLSTVATDVDPTDMRGHGCFGGVGGSSIER